MTAREWINQMKQEIKKARATLKANRFKYGVRKGRFTRMEEQLRRAIDEIKRQIE